MQEKTKENNMRKILEAVSLYQKEVLISDEYEVQRIRPNGDGVTITLKKRESGEISEN